MLYVPSGEGTTCRACNPAGCGASIWVPEEGRSSDATPILVGISPPAGGEPVETCDIILPTDRFLLSYRFPVD